jgi:hypothetical protein
MEWEHLKGTIFEYTDGIARQAVWPFLKGLSAGSGSSELVRVH